MQLRERVMAGGIILAGRQAGGLILNLAGITLLTRIVGPADYGLYVIALGIIAFLTMLSSLGVNTYLVRSETDPPLTTYQQALSLVVCTGTLSIIVAGISSSVIVNWLGAEQLHTPLALMLPTILFALVSHPSTAMIERELNYGTIAFIELAAQLAYFVVALALATADYGVYALVFGYWTQTLTHLVLSYRVTRLAPRFVMTRQTVVDMTTFGAGVSLSNLIWQSRSLLIPLLVGRYVGVEATAMVSLATRLVEAVTLLRRVFWRLALVSFAKIQNDTRRLQQVLDEAMMLQVLATGPFLAGTGLLAPLILPGVLGEAWSPALKIYPLVALATLVNAVFSMQSAVLQARRQPGPVAISHVFYISILTVMCLVLLPHRGAMGYAAAEVIALLSYAVLHHATSHFMTVTYRKTFPWLIACSFPLFTVFFSLGWNLLLLIPTVTIVFLPSQMKLLVSYLHLVQRTLVPRITRRAVT